jgi:hypothetical protein
VRRAAKILRRLCLLYSNGHKRAKQAVYAAVHPGLPDVLPCLSFAFSQLGASSGGAGTAQAVLYLLEALIAAFGKELGAQYVVDAVQLFVELFQAPGFAASLSKHVAAASEARAQHRRALSESSLSHSARCVIMGHTTVWLEVI